MLFKDLKAGYPVYILNKKDGIKASQGKAISVSNPYFPQVQMNQPSSMQTMQMVVDVTIEDSGVTHTYSIPETLSVTYASGLVLSTDRDGILRDVEALKSQSAEVLASVETHKATVAECERILEEWNPAFAEKKEQDKRISGLESKVEGIGKMLSDFINEFKGK